MDTYSRTCPRCETPFDAVAELAQCPGCELFSMIRRDGSFITLCPQFEALDGDEPLNDGTLKDVHCAAANGGAPLFTTCRYENYPQVDICHQDLAAEFNRLKSLLEQEIPDTQYDDIVHPSQNADWVATQYDGAQRLLVLGWHDGGRQVDLVCCMTDDGGMIDLLCDGTMQISR